MSAHIVGTLDSLANCTARRYEIEGRSIAVVRIDGSVYAIGDTCSHAEVSLSEGEVLCDTKEIECWKHGSAFSLETGEPLTLPATQPVPVYVASVIDGNIVIELQSAVDAEEAAS